MCTNLLIQSKNKSNIVSSRTMDFGIPFISKIHVVSRDQKFPSLLDLIIEGYQEAKDFKLYPFKKWTNKYGYVSAKMGGENFEMPTSIDGMNEKGLSGGALWLPCSMYPQPSKEKENILNIEVLDYILGTCANIEEVKNSLSEVNAINPLRKAATEHFIFIDINGDSLVVEFEDGEMKTYDNPQNGVLTNYPFYHEQIDNLKNYEKLTFFNTIKTKCSNEYSPQDVNGSGLLGLPADATPKSRFVRAMKLSDAIPIKCNSSQEWVMQARNILETLQVPKGIILKEEFNEPKIADYTQWSVIREHKNADNNLNYYFYTCDNSTLYKIALHEINWDIPNNSIELAQPNWYLDAPN